MSKNSRQHCKDRRSQERSNFKVSKKTEEVIVDNKDEDLATLGIKLVDHNDFHHEIKEDIVMVVNNTLLVIESNNDVTNDSVTLAPGSLDYNADECDVKIADTNFNSIVKDSSSGKIDSEYIQNEDIVVTSHQRMHMETVGLVNHMMDTVTMLK